ncbi:DUF1871 family protein [Paenibacillus rhizovicinus]|uniref:DUF1871 family protein n=1 Tax=Paenibacillus rhizovicinus TaxID=2704463 RepID=A0A6C0NTA5_9BACL|nr:DUF1871 family protein [Paenibacillus rhizovicinus]QHW29387.1 DUF1871 family protein [Paenibacillus rhizovicinus]
MGILITKLKEIIEEWDPYGLKPNNIYGVESIEILKCIQSGRTRNPEIIISYLQTILEMYYPDGKLNISHSEYQGIANKIMVVLDQPSLN